MSNASKETQSTPRPAHAAPPDRLPEFEPAPEALAEPQEASAVSLPPATPGSVRDDGVLTSGRLAGLSMNAAIVAVAWPVLAESVLNSTVGLVDTMLAAGLSGAAADAVGGAAYMLWFLGLITTAIGVGASALVSRSIGAGRPAVARAVLGQAFALSALSGLGLGVVMYLLTPTLAGLLSMTGNSASEFAVYLRAMCLAVPFSTVMLALMACSRGSGDTLRPLWAMTIVNIVNLLAAWLLAGGDFRLGGLVIPNPVHLHLGVLGIGLGTSIAHATGAALMVGFLLRGRSGIRLTGFWLRPHAVTIRRMVRLGLPNFAETFGMWLGNLLVIVIVGWLAADAVIAAGHDSAGLIGSHIIAIRIEALSFLPGFAMGVAASALVGQYLGAKRADLARRAASHCALAAAGIMGVMGLLFIFAGRWLTGLISQQPEHLALTPQLLMVTGFTQVPFALSIVYRSTLHGAGDVRAVMLLTWISTWLIRLPAAFVLSGAAIHLPVWLAHALGNERGIIENPVGLKLGLPGVWLGLCGELVLRAVIYGYRFLGNRWQYARV